MEARSEASVTPQELVDAMLAKARTLTGTQKFRYRFSSAGDPCLRALTYDAFDADDGVPPAESSRRLRDILAMACGNAVGEKLEEAARALGHQTQTPHEFDTGAVRISGRSDVADRRVVLDIKLVGERSWSRAPHPKHILQVNGYAVQNDSPAWALLYVRGTTIFDEDSPEVETRLFTERTSLEKAQELVGIWEEVHTHRTLRTLPERVFGAKPDGWPCKWCRHLKRCDPQKEE